MKKRQNLGCLALVALAALLLNPAPGAAFVTNMTIGVNGVQGFEAYPAFPTVSPFYGSTNYDDGWAISNARLRSQSPASQTYSYAGTNAAWLNVLSSGDSWIKTPLLSNGVGSITFYATQPTRTYPTYTNFLSFETSSNGIAWITNNVMHLIPPKVPTWYQFTNSINLTSPVYLRIHSVAASPSNVLTYLDNLVLSYPPATIAFTNAMPVPNPPSVNDSINLKVTLVPDGMVSNIAVTNFWSNDGGGTWHPIGMVTNDVNVWITTNAIPPQSAITIQYYFTASFQGPDALPSTSATNSFAVQVPAYTSGYKQDSFRVQGDLNTNLWLIGNYSWLGVAQSSAALTNALVKFRAETTNAPSTTNIWGDLAQSRTAFRIDGTASTNGASIVIGGTNSGAFVFTFVETNLAYSVDHGLYQSFDGWTPGSSSNAGWTTATGLGIGDVEHSYRGQSAQLPTNGWVMTPLLSNGVGQVIFWYRDFPSNGLPATVCSVQTSLDGASWTTTRTNLAVGSAVYQRFSLTLEDRNSRYLRLLNNSTNTQLCVDDLIVTDPYWAGVTFGATTNLPASPTATNAVTISALITPAAGTSNLDVTLYYRSGSNGAFSTLAMTNNGAIFSNKVAIAAGFGPDGGAGLVQYFIRCTFQGYNSSNTSPAYYPPDTNNPAGYTIARSFLVLTNAVTLPASPNATNAVTLALDVLPFAAASNASATAYYSFGSSAGPYTNLAMTTTGGNHYATSTPIPAPGVAGTMLYYYFSATSLGANPLVPTNYPAGGSSAPLSVQFRAAPFSSVYTNLVTTGGGLNPGMILVSNGLWQGVALATNQVNPGFVFTGQNGGGSTNFGAATQPVTNFPYYGVASGGAGNIVLSGTNNGPLVFSFDETSLAWSVLRASYVNFDLWTNGTGGYGTYTNSDGWVLTDGRVTSNAAPDAALAFVNRSGLLNAGPATNQSLRSPQLASGIGQISFWYRNAQTNGDPAAGFTVEVAPNATGLWTTVAAVTNLISTEYAYFTTTRSDRDNAYVRIRNLTTSNHPALCLDEVIIAEPGAGVAFSSVTNNPAAPIFTDNIYVSGVLSPLSGATGISARVYFRDNTNAPFDYVTMSTTGGNFFASAAIPPPAPSNTIQYYLVAYYYGFQAAQSSPVQYPAAGQAPLSYFVGDRTNTGDRVQGFEAYPAFPTVSPFYGSTNYDDGWAISNARLRSQSPASQTYSYAGTNAAWLNVLSSGDSWIKTPLLSNGVGSITFYATQPTRTYPTYTNFLSFETSSNGIAWITNNVMHLIPPKVPTWYQFTNSINLTSPVYLRIHSVAASQSNVLTYLDNLVIGYPVALVAVSNVLVNPGYPSITDTVSVACDIASVSQPNAAFGIIPKLWYRVGGVTNGPYPMSSIGGGRYQSGSVISNQSANTIVEYSIQVDFSGYYGSDAEKRSPFYYPGGLRTLQSWTNYPVRRGGSMYGEVDVMANSQPTPMLLISPYQWQGIFTIDTLTNQVSLNLQGLNPYTNGATQYGSTITLGDSSQWKTNTPISGTAQVGGSSITVNGALQGQYVLQYNEQSGQYVLRACVYQDFNNGWPATDPQYAFGSADNTPDVKPSFGLWSTNAPLREKPQTFVLFDGTNGTWDAMTYTNTTLFKNRDFTFWGANECQGPTNDELRTLNAINNGFIVRPNNNLAENWRGVGTMSVQCRVTSSVPTTVGLYLCPTNLNYNYDGDWINVASYWVTNTLSTISLNVHTSATMSVIMAHVQGNESVFFRSVNVSEWYADTRTVGVSRAENFTGSPWSAGSTYTNALISSSTEYGIYNCRIVSAGDNWAETPATNNQGYVVQANRDRGLVGVGTLQVSASAPGGDAGLAIYLAPIGQHTNRTLWSYVTGSSNLLSGGVTTNFQVAVNRATNAAIVFAHTYGDAPLRLGALTVTSYDASNAWVASEVWMESNSVSQCRMEASRSDSGTNNYLRTPLVSDRATQVQVTWLAGDTNPVSFEVYTTPGNNSVNWGTNKLSLASGSAGGTNVTLPATATYYLPLNSTNLFFWLVNTSDNNGALLVRDFVVKRVRSASLWLGNNVDVVNPADSRTFNGSQVCFMNSNGVASAFTSGVYSVLSDVAPFVQTPFLTNGIGEVSFWYRNWATSGVPAPASLNILASPTGGTNDLGWITLTNIPSINNTNDYIYFTYINYDSSNRYVRIQNNTNPPAGRVCLDNVIVVSPMSCDVVLSNLTLSPRIPIYTNTVNVTIDLADPFLFPSNIALAAYFQTGATYSASLSGPTNSRPMTCIDSNPAARWWRYQTTIPIPANPVDTFVKYWVGATFDGYLSQSTASPPTKINHEFVEPLWYRPVTNGTSNAYYIVFSCPTGAVWINEFNVVDTPVDYTYQYAELAGKAGAIIGNWRLYVYDSNYPTTTNASFTVPAGTTLLNATNGYGFWVLGMESVYPAPDMTFSNVWPTTGGFEIRRSNGSTVDAICFANLSNDVASLLAAKFKYAGKDSTLKHEPVFLTGSLTNGLTWSNSTGINDYTPGSANYNEVFPPLPVTDFTLTGSAGAHGTISPASTNVAPGGSASFVITATNGYRIASLTTNWTSVGMIFDNNSTVTNFTWSNVQGDGTLAATFTAQALTLPAVEVQRIWLNTNVWIVHTGSNGWWPAPWYTTNLLLPAWTNVPVFSTTYPIPMNGPYTSNFPRLTNAPAYFYKIVVTNATP